MQDKKFKDGQLCNQLHHWPAIEHVSSLAHPAPRQDSGQKVTETLCTFLKGMVWCKCYCTKK